MMSYSGSEFVFITFVKKGDKFRQERVKTCEYAKH